MAYVRRMSAKRTGVNPPYVRHISAKNVMKSRHHNGVCLPYVRRPPILQAYIRRISAVFPPYIRHIFAIYVMKARHKNGACLLYVRRLSADQTGACRPHFLRMSAAYLPSADHWPYTRHISAAYLPHVRHMSVYPPHIRHC